VTALVPVNVIVPMALVIVVVALIVRDADSDSCGVEVPVRVLPLFVVNEEFVLGPVRVPDHLSVPETTSPLEPQVALGDAPRFMMVEAATVQVLVDAWLMT